MMFFLIKVNVRIYTEKGFAKFMFQTMKDMRLYNNKINVSIINTQKLFIYIKKGRMMCPAFFKKKERGYLLRHPLLKLICFCFCILI